MTQLAYPQHGAQLPDGLLHGMRSTLACQQVLASRLAQLAAVPEICLPLQQYSRQVSCLLCIVVQLL